MKTIQNFAKASIIALAVASSLAACGGGGGGSTTTTSAPTPVTTTINGTVFNNVTTGAVVSAYSVNPDGSNGALLGTAAATGNDGRFTMTFNGAPSGYVRLVAAGGTYTSEADNTIQQSATLELVTPAVNDTENNFVITPITHFASRSFRVLTGSGMDSSSAFGNAMTRARFLAAENQPLKGLPDSDKRLLRTVPGSAGDSQGAYMDLVKAVEWFGVQYDIPSRNVVDFMAKAAEGNFNISHTDALGANINVGNWVGGAYDASQARTLNALVTPSTLLVEMQWRANEMFYEYAACTDTTKRAAYIARYPSQSNAFNDPAVFGPRCTYVTNRYNALVAKPGTNNRSK